MMLIRFCVVNVEFFGIDLRSLAKNNTIRAAGLRPLPVPPSASPSPPQEEAVFERMK